MKKSQLCQEDAKEQLNKWLEDEEWVIQERYYEDKEYCSCVNDILEHEVFQSMDQFIQHGDTTTKMHCIQVSYLSYCICKENNWDYRTAARAGLLHDLFLYDWHTHAKETGCHFHGFTHPRLAMENAIRYFHINEKEQNIILHHMWPLTPIPPKSIEGMVIVYSDKYCGTIEMYRRARRRVTGWLSRRVEV